MQPEQLGILLVLGENWEKGFGRHNKPRKLHRDSIDTTNAAYALLQSGKYNTAIFSTGFTNGPDQPSEADAMADRLLLQHPEISKSVNIYRETTSYDTPTNLLETQKLITALGLEGPITVVAPYHHLVRVRRTADKLKDFHLAIAAIPTEKVLDIPLIKMRPYEHILRQWSRIDPLGKVPSIVTKTRLRRHRLLPFRG